jgi:transposase
MANALSVDLRSRVVVAVSGGMSRRQAAARFGVSISSAIRWAKQLDTGGDIKPQRQGGDRRSQRIEAHATFILGEITREPDVTLAELQARLEERGVRFALSTIWRFFARHRVTFKKNRRMLPSRSART